MARSLHLLRALLFAGIVVSTIGCDQVTKQIARTQLADAPPLYLLGGSVRLGLALNEGGFLSLGASLPPGWRAAVFLVGVGALLLLGAAYLVRATHLPSSALLCGWLAWAGGLSNLLDRIVFDGRVTDFVVLGIGPLRTGVFNLADVAILAGAVCVALSAGRSQGAERERP